MKYIVSPRDSSDKLVLDDVVCCYQGGGSFVFHFADGRVRSYPQQHVWYVERQMEPKKKR